MTRAPHNLTLQLDIVIEDPQWQKKLRGLQRKIINSVESALLAQHKLALRADTYELSIILTSDAKMRTINRAHRGFDKPTNVLSFPLADNTMPIIKGEPVMLGDLILSYGVIEAESKAENKKFADHVTHLVIHGVLHLCGYDHETTGQARTMERLEINILHDFGIANPYLSQTP